MDARFFLGLAVLVTVPVTALLCRCRAARKKRIGFGTMLVGAFIPALLAFVGGYICEAGTDILKRHFWTDYFGNREAPILLFVFGFAVAVCVVPAMVVVIFYQARSKHETHIP